MVSISSPCLTVLVGLTRKQPSVPMFRSLACSRLPTNCTAFFGLPSTVQAHFGGPAGKLSLPATGFVGFPWPQLHSIMKLP